LACRKIQIQIEVHVHLWSSSCIGHAKNKVVYFLCCDRKAGVASVQNFTLWQQATIEITWRDHSIIACSCHIYLYSCVAHHASSLLLWIAFWFSTQRQLRSCKHSHLFTMNCTDRTFFLWRLCTVFTCDV